MEQSKKLIETMKTKKATSAALRTTKQDHPQKNERQMRWCKQWSYETSDTSTRGTQTATGREQIKDDRVGGQVKSLDK